MADTSSSAPVTPASSVSQWQQIKMPDGNVYNFPADMSDDDIRKILYRNFPDADRMALADTGKKPYQNFVEGAVTGVAGMPGRALQAPLVDMKRDKELQGMAARDFYEQRFKSGNFAPPSVGDMFTTPGWSKAVVRDNANLTDIYLNPFNEFAASKGVTDPEAAKTLLATQQGRSDFLKFLEGRTATSVKNIENVKEGIDQYTPKADVDPRNMVDRIGVGAITSLSDMAPTLATGRMFSGSAVKATLAGLAQIYEQTNGTGYEEARAAGLDPRKAADVGTLWGLAETIPEALPLEALFGATSKTFVRGLIKQMLLEGGSEVATEGAEATIEKVLMNKDLTWGEVQQRLIDAGLMGAVLGGGMHTAYEAAGKIGGENVNPDDHAPVTNELIVSPDFGGTPRETDPGIDAALGKTFNTPLIEREKRLALPKPVTPEDMVTPPAAKAATINVSPTPEQIAQRNTDRTRETLAAAKEVTTPVGAFSPSELHPEVVGKVKLWRMRTGRNVDAPISVPDMTAAKVDKGYIDSLVLGRKPLTTETDLSSTPTRSLESEVLRNAPFTEDQYNAGLASVRTAGRFTLTGLQAATGAPNPATARLIRDEMVRRGDLVQGNKPGTFKPYERPVATPPASPLKTHTVGPVTTDTVTVKKDGKVFGTYEDPVAAKDAVRNIRNTEMAEQRPASKVEIVRGGVDAEGRATPNRPAFAVYENRYDADGNMTGRAVVSTHESEETARNTAEKLNAQPVTPTAPNAVAPSSPRPFLRRATPARAATPTPKVLEGRTQEVVDKLNEQANRRALPLIGNRVVLTTGITDNQGQGGIEGSYVNQLITLAVDVLDPNMTTEQVTEALAGVMDHETIHALRGAGVLTEGTEAWRILSQYVQKAVHPKTGRTFIDEALAINPELADQPDVIVEEAIAEAFREWAANKRAVTGVPRTVFERIVDWFKRLIGSVPNDVFSAIETGTLVRSQIKAPISHRGAAVDAIEQARVKAAEATTDTEMLEAQRDMLRAREQAAEDRRGRIGPKTVIGTTPAADYQSGMNGLAADKSDVILRRVTEQLGPKAVVTPFYGATQPAGLRDIADYQERAKHEPNAPGVVKAYKQLGAQLERLFAAQEIQIEPWRKDGQPYTSVTDLLSDVADGRPVKMRLTADMFGPNPTVKDHPMNEPSSFTATDGTALSYNDLLRVVADIYAAPVRVGEDSDIRAFFTIRSLFPEDSHRALATEMLGQSAWQNYGPTLRLADGSIAPPDALGYVPPIKREFAQQKAYLLPTELIEKAVGQNELLEIGGEAVRFSRGIGFKQDNPAVSRGDTEWLNDKIKLAATRTNRIGGAITGYLERPIRMNPALIDELPGLLGEQPAPGTPKYDAVLADAQKNGWDFGGRGTVLVGVNDLGKAYVIEGNNRAAVAARLGIPAINVEVRWYNGGETVEGPWSPGSVAAKADTRYSRGVNLQTETPEFKRWFGNSKVVDATGKPMVAYHGTGKNFSAFSGSPDRAGFYFSARPDFADEFTANGESPNILPVYLSIQNPVDVSRGWPTDVADQLGAVVDREWLTSWPASDFWNALDGPLGQEIMAELKRLGYDGIIAAERGNPVYVAFEPTQIKSATGNNGQFDPANPDIRYSRGSLKTRMQPNGDTPDRIATRVPTTKRSTDNPLTTKLVIDRSAMKVSPEAYKFNTDLAKTYPGFRSNGTTPDQVADDFVRFIRSNLQYLYDRVPPEIRERTKRWYDGARALTERWAEDFGLPDYSVAGVIAVLSPQKDWYANVSMAERVLDIYFHMTRGAGRGMMPTPEMRDTAARIYPNAHTKPKDAEALRVGMTTPFADLPNSYTKAIWLRVYDQTYHPGKLRQITPEGDFIGEPTQTIQWQNNVAIAKAIECIENPSYENVSRQAGNEHKVRNFLNNILAPNAPHGDVTIDTHAVAAAHLRPLSSTKPEVVHAFGSSLEKKNQPPGYVNAKNVGDSGANGLYGLYAEAYRGLAKDLGILPRELQSITWEAVRGLFPDTFKRSSDNIARVDQIWNSVKAGQLDINTARQSIEAFAGGVNEPTWLRSGGEGTAEAGASSYEGELARSRVHGRRAAAGLGASGRNAGGVEETAARSGVQGTGVRFSRGVTYGPAEQSRLVSRGGAYRRAVGLNGREGQSLAGGVRRAATAGEKVAGIDAVSVREFPDGRHVYEINNPAAFTALVQRAKKSVGPIGAQVGEDPGQRQFLFDGGRSGFALDGDDIISVFSSNDSPKGVGERVLDTAVSEGGRRLNGFSTFLPKLYADNGFKAVAKVPFVDEYAPDGWDYAWFEDAFQNARPAITFMVYDPDNAAMLTDFVTTEYDDAVAAQQKALQQMETARSYNVGSPEFYAAMDEVLPGGKHYGNPKRSAAAVVVSPDTSSPAFSGDYDGNMHFGGDFAYQQLQMARDGDRGAVLTYMAPEDFLRVADQRPAREQRLYDVAAENGYKFNTMPSLVLESGKAGDVPVLNSDGVAMVRALVGKVKSIPVMLYPNGNGQIENIAALTGNGEIVDSLGLHEFDIERRGPREGLSSIAFNAWFKQSAVVDETNAPKRMYHNTKADRDFGIFSTQASEFGSHFGTIEQANAAAGTKNGHTYPVYLSVQNPIRLKDVGGFNAQSVADQLLDMGIIDTELHDNVKNNTVNGVVALQDALMDKGYDGVVYMNRAENVDLTTDFPGMEFLTKASDADFSARYPTAQDSYIVFQPTQVKSAIANRGTWSASNPDIRYSRGRNRRRVQSYGDAVYTAAQMKTDGLLGEYIENLARSKSGKAVSIFNGRINFQDKAIPFKVFADRLNRNGIPVPATINAAMVEEQLGSAAAYQDRRRDELMRAPLLEAIKKAAAKKRFDYRDMLDFLYARHAPERNQHLRGLKSKAPNPSGMSEAKAQKIMDDLRARGVLDEINALAVKYVDAIARDITNTRVASGLITAEQAAASPYTYWVPLRDTEDYDPFDIISKGPRADGVGNAFTSVGRAADPRTYGRNSEAGDILANLFTLQSVTLVRAERAKVQKAFHKSLQLPGAQAVIGDTLKPLAGVPKRLAYGSDGMIREIVDPNFRTAPGVVVFKIDGKEIAYKTDDVFLERALKGPLIDPMNSLFQGLITATAKYTALITTRNPAFTLPNLVRDYIEALVHSGQYKVPGMALGMTGRLPLAIKAIADYKLNEAKYKERLERGDTKGIDPMVIYYWEADRNGWLVSFLNYQDMSDRIKRMQREAGMLTGVRGNLANITKLTESFFHLWDGVNEVFEGATRLAFYATVRDFQKSNQKAEGRPDTVDAISEAGMPMKNLTVNFNKGGRYKPAMNANFLFSSVVANGAAATGKMLKSKRGQMVLGSVVAFAFVLDMLNRALSDDDNDDGIKDYDVMADSELNRNLYIPIDKIGIEQFKTPLKIPIALGPIGALMSLGRNLSRALNGVDNKRQPVSPLGSLGRIATSMFDAMNPFGDSNRPLNLITPWYLDPAVDLALNKNWADSNIVPPSYDETKPNSQRFYSTTDPIYISVAQGLSNLTGGNEVRGGWFDFSPEQYKYLVDFALAGTGKFLMDMNYAAFEALPLYLSGDKDVIKQGDLPIVSRFDTTRSVERGSRDLYYQLREEVEVTKKELRSENSDTRKAGRERVASRGSVQAAFSVSEKQIKTLREKLRAAQENKTMEYTARLRRIQEIRDQIDEVMARAVKRYYDAADR